METAQRLAGRSFGVSGVPFQGKLKACMAAETASESVSKRGGTVPRPLNVLFVCTGNSARSILAEAILNREGEGRFRAFSAGSQPTGRVHPEALALLRHLGHPTVELRSKALDEFLGEDAPQPEFVFTVCDAAAEACPVWPGSVATAHWGLPDPAAGDGGEARFKAAYQSLQARIRAFLALPFDALDESGLRYRLREIGAESPPMEDSVP